MSLFVMKIKIQEFFYLVLLHSPIVRKTSECSKRHPFNGYSKLINGKIFCKNISLVARINM